MQTVEDQERELALPNAPDLMGVAELAEALNVSKQRISELAASADFPSLYARLRAGPIWQRSSVSRFVADWPRRPGRRRKVVSA